MRVRWFGGELCLCALEGALAGVRAALSGGRTPIGLRDSTVTQCALSKV